MAYQCPETSNRNNFKYAFDWLLMLTDLLPILRRKTKIFTWCSIPFKWLWNRYLAFLQVRFQALFETAANGQSLSLELFLNMLFDPNDRTITIVNILSNFETMYLYQSDETPAAGDESFLYNRSEPIPPSGNQEYIFNRSEIEASEDFIVKIPTALYVTLTISQVAAIVDKYKFVGTKYRIEQC